MTDLIDGIREKRVCYLVGDTEPNARGGSIWIELYLKTAAFEWDSSGVCDTLVGNHIDSAHAR